jgi:hypothetical protein
MQSILKAPATRFPFIDKANIEDNTIKTLLNTHCPQQVSHGKHMTPNYHHVGQLPIQAG